MKELPLKSLRCSPQELFFVCHMVQTLRSEIRTHLSANFKQQRGEDAGEGGQRPSRISRRYIEVLELLGACSRDFFEGCAFVQVEPLQKDRAILHPLWILRIFDKKLREVDVVWPIEQPPSQSQYMLTVARARLDIRIGARSRPSWDELSCCCDRKIILRWRKRRSNLLFRLISTPTHGDLLS